MKVDRLVGMIVTLLNRGRVGAQELADIFEVSPRTIYRDMEAINMAGIPVRSTPGAGGGFEIMPDFKVDKMVFSAADLSAILMGLTSLSQMVRDDELANALAKVKSFVPADRDGDIALRANQLCIDLSPWLGNPDTRPYLERIKTALRDSRLLSFDYVDRRGNRTARTAEPYRFVLKSSHWYVQAYCRERGDFRLFRLSRIANLRAEEERFTPRDCPPPILDFSEALERMQIKIKVRIHQSALERALDFCRCEDVTPDGDEHSIASFPFVENDYHYRILLGFGDACECLGPPHIRAEMGRRARGMAALYEGQ